MKKVIIGTSGWIYRDWQGKFYPKDLPKSQWFDYYQDHFQVVEINATFYRLFEDKVFLKWKEKARKDFQYIIKTPRIITHVKYLKNCNREIKKFCKSVNLLETKLSLILLQLPPNMPYDLVRLEKALRTFDDPTHVVVEFRHSKWITNEVKRLLKKIGCIFCAANSPSTKLIDWITSPIGYIRLHGKKRWYNYRYSTAELKQVKSVANKMLKHHAKKVYVLFNNDYHAYAIQNAMELTRMIK